MKADIIEYCCTCDICQKVKVPNFSKFGFLILNPIPSCPYQSISMDFIVNSHGRMGSMPYLLQWIVSLNNAHLYHAQQAEEFAELFVHHIICQFRLPDSIITDRDPQWTSDFLRGMACFLKTKMSLSSAHHPKHNRQTEILNKHLVTMILAYISEDLADWVAWLHILEFAYNNTIHSSTGALPNFLTYGFQPKNHWTSYSQ